MFLKDTWRPGKEGIDPERKTYEKLAENKVPCVASFFCGDDVIDPSFAPQMRPDDESAPLEPSSDSLFLSTPKSSARPGAQTTKTQEYIGCDVSRSSRKYIHYRMVQDTLYVPLDQFDNSRRLVQIMYDAIRGK